MHRAARAATKVGLELVKHEGGQFAASRFQIRKKRRPVLLRRSVEQSCFGTTVFVRTRDGADVTACCWLLAAGCWESTSSTSRQRGDFCCWQKAAFGIRSSLGSDCRWHPRALRSRATHARGAAALSALPGLSGQVVARSPGVGRSVRHGRPACVRGLQTAVSHHSRRRAESITANPIWRSFPEKCRMAPPLVAR